MNVIMPQLGETVLEGSVAAWHKKVGEVVQADETLFDVETDKVTSEIPAPVAGILKSILVPTGVTVKVGTVLAVIEAEGSAAQDSPAIAPVSEAGAPVPPRPANAGRPALDRAPAESGKLSPVVRRLLGENALSPEEIQGTGRNGRITREDVLGYLDRGVPTPAAETAPAQHRAAAGDFAPAPSAMPAAAVVAGADDIIVPQNKVRRATAAHMARSKTTIPHAVQAVEVDFRAVDKVRNAVGRLWKEREGYSLTYMPFISRAVCEAIGRYPYVNSTFADDNLIVHKRVHLGIAVDVDFEGLLATVVRDAHHRNLRGLAAEINRLAAAARGHRLKPDELAGGTYTISNSGTFGTLFSTSIINSPQAAILSVDGVRKRPVVVEGPDGDGIAIRPVGVLAQSFDHRAFDGAYSASFLRCVKEVIETRDWSSEL